jgi:phospholipid transport system substrate-binding protein
MKIRFTLLALAMTLAALGGAFAAPPPEEAQALVQQTSERMLERLEAEREAIEREPARLYELVHDIVLPHFDFEYMSQWVLGRHWRAASPEQRARFVQEFRTLLVRTYGSALNEYRDQAIHYLPLRAEPGAKEVTVRTEVQQPGAFSIPIHYSMHLRAGVWQVYDVVIDGVSLVTNYRSSFGSEIARGGIDRLIDRLAQRNRQAAT